MATHLDLRVAGSVVRYDPKVFEAFEPRLFDPAWLTGQGHIRGQATGRGAAQFIHFEGRDLVLRPYLRGGMMRHISRDMFARTTLEATRPMQEFALLQWMGGQGLPVPRVVAAQMSPTGPFYRAAILTERIPKAQPLEDHLRAGPLPEALWHEIGRTIGRLHGERVYHSDLNRRNILLQDGQSVWLIDFDKCARRAPGAWGQENLDRLHRSLMKDDGQGALHWSEADWAALLTAYGQKVTAE